MEITLDDYFSKQKKKRNEEFSRGSGIYKNERRGKNNEEKADELNLDKTKKFSRLHKVLDDDEENSGNKVKTYSEYDSKKNKEISSNRNLNKNRNPLESKRKEEVNNDGLLKGGFDGLSIVVTGTFSKNSRSEIENMVKILGGKLTSAVSGKTSYLIAGNMLEDGRSIQEGTKYRNAISKGVKILSEDEFLEKYFSFKENEDEMLIKNSSMIVKNNNTCENNNAQGKLLWTNKHKPESIEEVLGNGDVIKKLHSWLIDWNSVVIQGRKKPIPKPTFSPGSRFPQTENINARAVLISGPPGIGKSTVASLMAKKCGYIPIEMNASDDRTKEIIENLSESAIGGYSLSTFAKKGNLGGGVENGGLNMNMLLIMDEMDGLGGSDRGGAAALGRLIQKTRWPIICICNDRMNEKVRNLASKCYDLKFSRPTKNQIVKRMQAIANNEGMNIEPNAIELLCESVGNDLRQILNELQLLSLTNNNVRFTDMKKEVSNSIKDVQVTLDIFSATKKLLNSAESSNLTLTQKLDLFFIDFDLMPLLLQENYITAISIRNSNVGGGGYDNNAPKVEHIRHILDYANSFVESDIYNSKLRTDNEWSLLHDIALLNCSLNVKNNGLFLARPEFPKWLGKNSNKNKNKRLLSEITSVITVGTSGNCPSSKILRISGYLDLLYYRATEPLLDNKMDVREAIDKSISIMNEYCLNRNYLTEHISCLMLKNQVKAYDQVDSKVKSTMTRVINSTTQVVKYSVQSSKKRKKDEDFDYGDTYNKSSEEYDQASDEYGDEDNESNNKNKQNESNLGSLIKVVKKTKSGGGRAGKGVRTGGSSKKR
ncbi:replication factor C subunit 1 [Cryptosporidium ryanae]|uniref:replication factor C subunit 1 n=1 Tax=Cryptosporidium ryanae TaxID=515981 RepID=UPI00351A2363|nr:replication factor C subunit 1 [Cryptosporidium ryanae]